MAKGTQRRHSGTGEAGENGNPLIRLAAPYASELVPGMLVTFPLEGTSDAVATLRSKAGLAVAHAADYGEGMAAAAGDGADATIFPSLGVAVLDADPDQQGAIAAAVADKANPLASRECEPIFFAFGGASPDFAPYLRGYRDAVNALWAQLNGEAIGESAAPGPLAGLPGACAAGQAFADSLTSTWGLTATGVEGTALTGRGVKLAILDTGIDIDHPDFRGRLSAARMKSFIPGQDVDDLNGHGTHCAGTAAGSRQPQRGPRYGIASEAELYIGKVLSNTGAALGRSTVFGIEWAVSQGCRIISMSIGGRILPGAGPSPAFETLARNALRSNALIIAAAGNDSRRSQTRPEPVSSPANCPSIMAVAALDRALRVADFSNAAVNPSANIDIAAPGVQVYSSAPEPAAPPQPPRFRPWRSQYDLLDGTSMATPHVAGIAALLLQQNPSLSASELWRMLVSRAQPLSQPASDVGAGLARL
ncbi:subtilisin family serine protease [Sphingomonas naasensis]|uniref:Protease n=1 Tax=Sphingomonas naasensis TaxID=1344951 RepID=A0A4S1WHZ6_9SPHN|nr:S8 family serine peptidase [Sphingomonas naasensis]NIJ22030.1 subtilisin family serine protease [Sphingomonas naasensis]TGX42293.1 protease [Sphingomonas naasensis]